MARDLTTGSIPRHIFALAFPAVLSTFAIVVNNFVDTALVGHLGDEELAAVGSAGFLMWIIFSLMDLISVGTVALISRSYGAKDLKGASSRAMDINRFAFFFSSILAAAGILLADDIISLLNLGPEVERMATIYIRIVFLSVPPLFFAEVVWSIFRAVGDTKTPMILMAWTVAINILLDIFLIYGIWIFPRLEVVGAGIATTVAHTFAGLIGLYFVKAGRIPFKIIPANLFKIDFKVVMKTVKIGLPISLAGLNFTLVYLVLTRIMSEFGTAAVASIPVGNRVESISYMTCHGFYMAVSSMVGQNLGARNPARAAKSVWASSGIMSAITLFFGAIFVAFPEYITVIFSEEPDVIRISADYLRILGLSQLFMGFEFVFEGAFTGAGHTIPPTIVSVPGTLIRIPLAYYLAISLGLGPIGVFWAITISTVIKGIWLAGWFKFGKWYKEEL
jgi:putative MATE family efflux protein